MTRVRLHLIAVLAILAGVSLVGWSCAVRGVDAVICPVIIGENGS